MPDQIVYGDAAGNMYFVTEANGLPTKAFLAAGEVHIGEVGGFTKVSTSSPVVTAASAYASGNLIGGKLTFAGLGRIAGGTGLVQMGAIASKAAQSFACDLVLFHTDPAATTFTDKSAFALHATDWDKVLGVVPFTAASWYALGTPSFAQATALAMAYKVASGQSDIYGALVSRGTPTFGSTSDLKVIVKGLLD